MTATIGGAALIGTTSRSRLEVRHYRGHDRRGMVTCGFHVMAAAGLTIGLSVLLWATMLVLDVISGPEDVQMATASRVISALAAAVAVAAGTMSIARWRLSGDALAMAAGLGTIVIGVATIGLGGLIGATEATARAVPPFVRAFGPAGVIAAIGCLIAALRLPQVDTSLRLARSVAAVVATVGASAVLITAAPGILAMFGPGTADPVGRSILATGWIVLAIAFVRDAHRMSRAVAVWMAGLLVCLAEAHLARLLSVPFGATWDLAGRLFTLVGALVAYAGAVQANQDTARVLRARLLDTVVAERTARADRQAERAARDELDHDLRSALLAIGGAATTLERYADRLGPGDRGSLMESLTSEIGRIQSLVSGHSDDVRPFAPALVARRLARCDEARGASIAVEVSDDLRAVGSPARTAEILRNLIDNALLHGCGQGVVVRAERIASRVVVTVEDRGDGLPEGAAEQIFERGWTMRANHPSMGSGLGLFVARRLAEEQGGQLTARNRAGGGAVFELALPAFDEIIEEDA